MIELSADPARRSRERPRVAYQPDRPFVSETFHLADARRRWKPQDALLGPLRNNERDVTITREEYHRRVAS
jgi:hypothetical protein